MRVGISNRNLITLNLMCMLLRLLPWTMISLIAPGPFCLFKDGDKQLICIEDTYFGRNFPLPQLMHCYSVVVVGHFLRCQKCELWGEWTINSSDVIGVYWHLIPGKLVALSEYLRSGISHCVMAKRQRVTQVH